MCALEFATEGTVYIPTSSSHWLRVAPESVGFLALLIANGCRVSIWSVENMLEMDSGDGCPNLRIY